MKAKTYRLLALMAALLGGSWLLQGADEDPGKKLLELMRQGAALSRQLEELSAQMGQLAKPVPELLAKYFPAEQEGGKWQLTYGGGSFVHCVLNAPGPEGKPKQLAWLQVLYHDALADAEKAQFDQTCVGYPAKRFKDRGVWVLVGKFELRLSAVGNDSPLVGEAKLDAALQRFDLAALAKL